MVARPTRKRMYRTMQGRMVDIEKLRAVNENVRAIGNMSVNARGDVLSPGGEIIKPRATVMKEYYQKPKGVVSDVATKRVRTPRVTIPKEVVETKVITPQPKIAQVTPQPFKPKTKEPESKKGIDAALDGIE